MVILVFRLLKRAPISPPIAPITMKIIRWYAFHRRLSSCREGSRRREMRRRGRRKEEGKGSRKREGRCTHTHTHTHTHIPY